MRNKESINTKNYAVLNDKTLLTLFCIFCIVISGFCYADTSENLDAVKLGFQHVKSVSASFIQEKHLKIVMRPLISEGMFYYKSPSSLRWEYFSPVQSIMLMHGTKVRRYIKASPKGELNGSAGYIRDDSASLQAIYIVLQEITGWLNGSFNENPNFTATLADKHKIVLMPKAASVSSMIQKIELHLSNTAGIIDSVMIFEDKDSFTRLKFKNSILNPAIADRVFTEIE